MRQDEYGQYILTESDLFDLYMRDPDRILESCFVNRPITFHTDLELSHTPDLAHYEMERTTMEAFDGARQSRWFIPESYKDLDIAQWLLDQCQTDAERQRVGQELLLYVERDMLDLLVYLKYLVDTMRANNIVWGVGRGSSVASYVLFLLGVHKINSMYYDLDIKEFLR